MRWFAIGPAFVQAPRNADYRRVSSRNCAGEAAKVDCIAVAASDPAVMYIVSRPQTSNAAAFRTEDSGRHWTSICDGLQMANPGIDPAVIVVHPRDPEYIVMGTVLDQGVYVSTTGGRTWGPKFSVPAWVTGLVIDQRPSATTAASVYAATTTGLYRSTDGGSSFDTTTPLVAGPVYELVGDIPDAGPANVFAGVWGAGIWHAHDPSLASDWVRISGGAGGLPSAVTPSGDSLTGLYDRMLIALCPNNPGRSYVWLFYSPAPPAGAAYVSRSLWTAADPRGAWTMVPSVGLPNPGQNFYCARFAAAPNSRGDGTSDILLFCEDGLQRSVDGGRTWRAGSPDILHADHHALAFAPVRTPPDSRTVLLIGCDGGIGKSSGWTDRTYDLTSPVDYWNEGAALTARQRVQNLNHWYRAQAMDALAIPRGVPTFNYAADMDTGLPVGDGNQTWRLIEGADVGAVCASAGPDGIGVWWALSYIPGPWPGWGRLRTEVDTGHFGAPWSDVHLVGPGNAMAAGGPPVAGADGTVYYPAIIRDTSGTLQSAVPAVGMSSPIVSTSAGLSVGDRVVVDDGAPTAETVTVSAVTPTTFTAGFTQIHAVGAPFVAERNIIVRIPRSTPSSATQILGDQHDGGRAFWLAADPSNADVLYAVRNPTMASQQVWRTTNATTVADWTQIASVPTSSGVSIMSVDVGPSGQVYVLFGSAVGPGSLPSVAPLPSSPLWEVSSGSWLLQLCAGLPAGGLGQLSCDPVDPTTLYLTAAQRVYRLARAGDTWSATDISDGLPGRILGGLYAVDVGSTGAPHVVLRTFASASGVWERDAADLADPSPRPYVRGNIRDPGYLRPMPESVPNPYQPSAQVWHYQSPDVVIDAEQADAGQVWHQIDPEYSTLPIDAVAFGQLRDNSQQLPGLEPAMVHVQVHNRSSIPAANVSVWALAAPAAGGLPSLFRSDRAGNAFAFWSQFEPTGEINPAMPSDSPWKAVGPPAVLASFTADDPGVATWTWDVPLPRDGHPLHYCIAVFIHSAASPLNLTTGSVDDAAVESPQVAQKNLHIMPVLVGGGG